MDAFIDFLDWLARATGVIAVILAVIGFLWKEKWKQMLARSLGEDLERLRAKLNHEQLAAQHDFQQKLEFYKVSLIAQAEEVRIRGDVKKSIATRYVEIQFNRLVKLEADFSVASQFILSAIQYPPNLRRAEQLETSLNANTAAWEAAAECEMFLSHQECHQLYIDFRAIFSMVSSVGVGADPIPMESAQWTEIAHAKNRCTTLIRGKIHGIAEL